jgi:hypothetical protein
MVYEAGICRLVSISASLIGSAPVVVRCSDVIVIVLMKEDCVQDSATWDGGIRAE